MHYALSGTVPVVSPHVAGYKWPTPVGVPSTAGPPLHKGPCWQCGRVGHFRKFCPQLQGMQIGGNDPYNC